MELCFVLFHYVLFPFLLAVGPSSMYSTDSNIRSEFVRVIQFSLMYASTITAALSIVPGCNRT